LLDDDDVRLWIEEMDFDPRPIFAQVRVPTLAFFGDADSWTPVEASVEAWRDARGQQVEVVIVAGAGHDLTYPDGTFAPEYERKLVAWVGRRVAAR
jgi:pimeloyl-ACP methyl ester carboxylesterase